MSRDAACTSKSDESDGWVFYHSKLMNHFIIVDAYFQSFSPLGLFTYSSFLHFACRLRSFIACLDPYAGLVRFWFCVIATLTFLYFIFLFVFIYIVACDAATWLRLDAQTRPNGEKNLRTKQKKKKTFILGVGCRKESIIENRCEPRIFSNGIYDGNGHMQYIHTSTCYDFEHAETAKMTADLQL